MKLDLAMMLCCVVLAGVSVFMPVWPVNLIFCSLYAALAFFWFCMWRLDR